MHATSWVQMVLFLGILCLMTALIRQLLVRRAAKIYLWDFSVFPVPKECAAAAATLLDVLIQHQLAVLRQQPENAYLCMSWCSSHG